MAEARSRQAQLQRLIDGRGIVEAFVPVPDRIHLAVGWYVQPLVDVDGCDCKFCVAARTDTRVFVAGGAFLAAALLHDYVETHPAPVAQATG